MMRLDSFARSALFAAGAAALWPAFAMTAAPFVGWRPALAIYLAGVTTLYVTGLGGAGGARHRAIALATAGVVLAFAAFAHTTAELAVALAAVLGCVRSALLYRTRPARAVATEVALLAGGLIFARFLAGPSVLSIAVALWGFFLVQSLFFLVARPKPRAHTTLQIDPFDEAHRRATTLLDDPGGRRAVGAGASGVGAN